MQFLVLDMSERFSADVACVLWLIVNKHVLSNVGSLTASAVTATT